MYLLGIVAAALVSLVLKSTILKGQPSHLVMEMPPYHLPSITLVVRNVWDRILLFVKDAGTVILACSVVLWFLASYPRTPTGEAPQVRESYAGELGSALEPVIRPLGFDWRIGVSIVASFAAREVFVGSMATVNNLENVDERSESLIEALRHTINTRTGERYTLAVALSLMVFYCFACQCMSTLAVCRRETGSWRWPTFMFVYMTLLAYGASLVTYQIASRVL
jgi:ferrous iron transport protein B